MPIKKLVRSVVTVFLVKLSVQLGFLIYGYHSSEADLRERPSSVESPSESTLILVCM
jgi:hypothetical protein